MTTTSSFMSSACVLRVPVAVSRFSLGMFLWFETLSFLSSEVVIWFAAAAERGAQLGGEELRLLPRGEVAAFVDLVEVGQVAGRRAGPTSRGPDSLPPERP